MNKEEVLEQMRQHHEEIGMDWDITNEEFYIIAPDDWTNFAKLRKRHKRGGKIIKCAWVALFLFTFWFLLSLIMKGFWI